MSRTVTEEVVQRALEDCASEPIHIPGLVQSFGCLLALDVNTHQISYVSENSQDILGIPCDALLGQSGYDILGSRINHSLRNAAATPVFEDTLCRVGSFELNGRQVDIGAFRSGGHYVLEIEASGDARFRGSDAFSALSLLMKELQACESEQGVFDLMTKLLKHLCGYDRVMIYRFDPEYNGEVVAEAVHPAMPPFLGLRFPHWDIPAQAREIMKKVPLRIIQDVDLPPAPLRAAYGNLGPLDISLSAARGVSPVHLEYLRNMKTRSNMTLSVMIGTELWGMISFHHRHPRVPSVKLREVLTSFIAMFGVKLLALQEAARIELMLELDRVKDDVLNRIGESDSIDEVMPYVGPLVEMIGAIGIGMRIGAKITVYGQVPSENILLELLSSVQKIPGQVITHQALAPLFPGAEQELNGCAGSMATAISPDQALCVFRPEVARNLNRAGKPDKTIQETEGRVRLSPQGSFATYMQNLKGHCEPWSQQDIYLAGRVWAIVSSAERRALLNNLTRQQRIMIDELNHRVRNILALVRSVSRQTQRQNGSLESYSAALESRIKALAASHEIVSDVKLLSVSLVDLIQNEVAPFGKEGTIRLSGVDRRIRSDVAPIFSLVIHELTTNAVKHGSLSVENGTIDVSISDHPDGVEIRWIEAGGPLIEPPKERGFGSTLIESAVPHELNGRAKLCFHATGVEAILILPAKTIDASLPAQQDGAPLADRRMFDVAVELPPKVFDGFAMLVEDNYVIARDMVDVMGSFGITNVETFSNAQDALGLLADEVPGFAILDVNLGGNQTSLPIATRLKEMGVPYFFVTGYGESAEIGPALQGAVRLTKPVAATDMKEALSRLFA